MEFSRELTDLLHRDSVEDVFAGRLEENPFTPTSNADVFEVTAENGGSLRRKMDDGQIRPWLSDVRDQKSSTGMRIIFIDGIEDQPDKLPVTSSILRDICQTFAINSRFVDCLARQRMPGRAISNTPDHQQRLKHEMWWSAVIRSDSRVNSNTATTVGELTRQVSNWQRFCMWSDYQLQAHDKLDSGTVRGPSACLIWRCPTEVKEAFYRTFTGEAGKKLLSHPMLVHAFILDRIVKHAYEFLKYFSGPMYQWENKANDLASPDDYTARSRAFLSLSRKIYQVSTDIDILKASIEHLREQLKWVSGYTEGYQKVLAPDNWQASHRVELDQMGMAQSMLDDMFGTLANEAKLVMVYATLYLERSKIGVEENFAMINQRDSEINLQMASESTSIALASHQDNRSLRIIQILSMIFLPGSLVSSIFGMGFFSTSADSDGSNAVFTASSKWWYYFAVAVPLTVAIMVLMIFYQKKDEAGPVQPLKVVVTDPEAQTFEKKRT